MSKKNKLLLKQTGTTTDGKPVYADVYKFFETHGLPLDVILTAFQQQGWVVDWMDFYLQALSAGMKHDRILSKLQDVISDAYGIEYEQAVLSRLDTLFKDKPHGSK